MGLAHHFMRDIPISYIPRPWRLSAWDETEIKTSEVISWQFQLIQLYRQSLSSLTTP